MSEPEAPPPTQDQLMQEAAAWFARMRGPDAEASRDEFEGWLRRGALHRSAYNRAAEIFAMGKVLAEDQVPPAQEPRATGSRHPRRTFAMLAALLVLLAAAWLVLNAMSDRQPWQPHKTGSPAGIGSTARFSASPAAARTARLPDNSLVTLSRGARIETAFSSSERRIRLEKGQARFEVSRDRRPFVVDAGGGSITARGTVFDVAVSPGRRVMVRLVEGIVDVTFPSGNEPATTPAVSRMRPGETLSFTAAPGGQAATTRPTGSSDAINTSTVPAHVQDYEAVTIAALVEAANRGSARPIRIERPAIGERRVTGRFQINDTGLLAERLALLFDLVIDQRDRGEILLRAR
jgi:transmembrane sensor